MCSFSSPKIDSFFKSCLSLLKILMTWKRSSFVNKVGANWNWIATTFPLEIISKNIFGLFFLSFVKNIGQSCPLFRLFSHFSYSNINYNFNIWTSADGMLGIRTLGRRIVGADETTALSLVLFDTSLFLNWKTFAFIVDRAKPAPMISAFEKLLT